MTTLVTGAAGFIGHFVSRQLVQQGQSVVGLDNFSESYAVQLKQDRINRSSHELFTFVRCDMADAKALEQLFEQHPIKRVVHLAAEAGAHLGADQPAIFVDSNLVAFNHLLECCRHHAVEHLLYASSAAVYGDTDSLPTAEQANSDHPLTLYAATKKANEVMAHSYAHMYGLVITGLRFFTVYGPWGRPDMALHQFAHQVLMGQPIELHNQGQHTRDLIYIDDLVEAITLILASPPVPAKDHSSHQIFNLGNQQPVPLLTLVKTLEQQLGVQAEHRLVGRQPGVVLDNHADASKMYQQYGFKPRTALSTGVAKFVDWFREYYTEP